MPSLKDIRKRIGSVKNTQKITRAMKLVAAAKLRRANDAIVAARPYSESLESVVVDLAARAGRESHPLLTAKDGKRVQVLVMTSDRGLAGSFNAQIIRAVEHFVAEELADGCEVSLRLVGRKSNDYFKRRDANIRSFNNAPTSPTALDLARDLATELTVDFLGVKPGEMEAKLEDATVDRVYVVYNRFVSAMTQIVTIQQILPIEPKADEQDQSEAGGLDLIYEPSKEDLLAHLLPQYLQFGLFRAALESIASELGSRMSAMDSATRNAGDMIDRLTLEYNRARQAAITKELLEIISGSESLQG